MTAVNNTNSYSQNISGGDQTTNIILASSNAFYGSLGIVSNLILMCYLLKGFKKRKAYEYILFTTTLVNFLQSINRSTLYVFATLKHNETVCKYSGLLIAMFACQTVMLLTVNMLDRYLSLLNLAFLTKRMMTRIIVISSTVLILLNLALYIPQQQFDVYGFDPSGVCSRKAPTDSNRIWILLNGVELFSCSIANIILGLLVIRKLRAHVNKTARFKSKIVQESKQITKLALILTIWPMASIGGAYIVRLFPHKSMVTLWVYRFLLLLSPTMSVLIPIATIFIIKPYKKSFVRFFRGTGNRISVIEPTELKQQRRTE